MIEVPYTLVRVRGNRMSVGVGPGGKITVKVPHGVPISDVESFLRKNQEWILRKRRERIAETVALITGANLLWKGEKLSAVCCAVPMPVVYHGFLLLPKEPTVRQSFLKWRMAQSKLVLAPRVEYWCRRLGVSIESLSFGNAVSRWGSMTETRHLRLNTALMHCPQRLWDLVIVHELCHLRHMDHSAAFHAEVRAILPEEQALNKEIRDMRPYLML